MSLRRMIAKVEWSVTAEELPLLRHLGSLHELREVHLHDGPISLESLRGLVKLEVVDLRETGVTDEGLTNLANLPRLRVVRDKPPRHRSTATP